MSAQPKYMPSGAMTGWTSGDVCAFLREAGLAEEVVALFAATNVDGDILSFIDDTMLANGPCEPGGVSRGMMSGAGA